MRIASRKREGKFNRKLYWMNEKREPTGSLFFHGSGSSPAIKAVPKGKQSVRSVFLGQFVEFGQREDRAVLTDIFLSHIAAAALPDPALHPHLQRGDDVFLRKTEFEEDRQREPDHDRGAADHRHGVFGARGDLPADRRDKPLPALPVRIPFVHRDIEGDIVPLRPRGEFILVDQKPRISCPVDHCDLAEAGAVPGNVF